jgi:hypothetical protein
VKRNKRKFLLAKEVEE